MTKIENMNTPDENGRFGDFGGRFVSETLMPPILELEAAYNEAKADPDFLSELDDFFAHYVGRPSPLYFAERLTEFADGAKIYFKRDELNHTGAHKINNCMGQILLAKRMGRQWPRALDLSVLSIWGRQILSGKSQTYSACACSGLKSALFTAAQLP